MLKLTNDETSVLLALERLATLGIEWRADDPSDYFYGLTNHLTDDIPFCMLAMYVAGEGDITTSNRISFALRRLCVLGFVKQRFADGPPDWLHHLPRTPKSRSMLCPDGRVVHFALAPPSRLLITRPDRPSWQWQVDYGQVAVDTRYAITEAGALAAGSLESGPPEQPTGEIVGPSRAKHKKAGGRPSISESDARKRKRLVEQWIQAKAAGVRQKDFCNEEAVPLKNLTRCINWVAQRRRRSNAP